MFRDHNSINKQAFDSANAKLTPDLICHYHVEKRAAPERAAAATDNKQRCVHNTTHITYNDLPKLYAFGCAGQPCGVLRGVCLDYCEQFQKKFESAVG